MRLHLAAGDDLRLRGRRLGDAARGQVGIRRSWAGPAGVGSGVSLSPSLHGAASPSTSRLGLASLYGSSIPSAAISDDWEAELAYLNAEVGRPPSEDGPFLEVLLV